MVTKEQMGQGAINQKLEMNIYVYIHILYIRQMANKYLLYRAGNSIFCDNIYDKIFFKRMDICIGITESLCSTPETYTTL